jgi:hypothetical protein
MRDQRGIVGEVVSVIALALLQFQTTIQPASPSHVTSTNMRIMAKLESGIRLIEENRVMEHLMQDVELVIGRPRLRLNTQVLQVYTHLNVIKTSELVQGMTGNDRSKKYVRVNQVQTRLLLCACFISDLASYGMQFTALDWHFEYPMRVL